MASSSHFRGVHVPHVSSGVHMGPTFTMLFVGWDKNNLCFIVTYYRYQRGMRNAFGSHPQCRENPIPAPPIGNAK